MSAASLNADQHGTSPPARRPTPRFWWAKRLGGGAVVLIAVWAGFHWWFTQHVKAADQRALERWRADGSPHPDEIARATGVPPDTPENAAGVLVKAMNLPAMTQEQQDWDNSFRSGGRFEFGLSQEDVEMMRGILRDCESHLQLLHGARAKPELDWGLPAGTVTSLLPYLNSQRQLAERAGWSMELSYHDGDLHSALERAQDGLFLGSASIRYGPCLVSSLVGSGINALVTSRLRNFALAAPAGMSQQQQWRMWREARPQVEAVIAELLDDTFEREVMRLAFQGERTSIAGAWSSIATPGSGILVGLITEPVLRADLRRAAERVGRVADAAKHAQTLPELADLLAQHQALEPPGSIAGTAAALLSSILVPSLDRAIISFYRIAADRRATAVVLAVKLYQAEHEGELPESLESLVPDYLPFVPRDPMAPGEAPLQYHPRAAIPIIYSVGDNMADDGGSTAADATRRVAPLDAHPQFKLDLVFPLAPSPLQGVDPWNYLFDGGESLKRQRMEYDLGIEN